LDALFKALEYQGGRALQSENQELLVEVSEQRSEMQFQEKQKQVGRPLDEDEACRVEIVQPLRSFRRLR